MNNFQLLLLLTCSLILSFANSVNAVTEIEINGETAIKNQQLDSGKIKVLVNYIPFNPAEIDTENNLSYQIYYQGRKQLEDATFTMLTGEISLQDLDSNGIDEVIINTYSGGAHCCTNFIIYTWLNDKFIKTETGFLNGGGGSFEDLNRDGKYEFLTNNNAFLYQFSSYVGSFPPSLIYTFNQGQLIEVTKNYSEELRARLIDMEQALQSAQKDGYEINGILAGYVAQKILLGEYQEGWRFMLKSYDKSSDWGLFEYDENGNVTYQYPDFPTALRAFLIKQGYLIR